MRRHGVGDGGAEHAQFDKHNVAGMAGVHGRGAGRCMETEERITPLRVPVAGETHVANALARTLDLSHSQF